MAKKRPAIRINEFTISLYKREIWVARKDRKIVAKNEDWVLLLRGLGIYHDSQIRNQRAS